MAQEADHGMIDAAPTSDELLQAALEYARSGWAVFPCHSTINGRCDCTKGPDCTDAGKHPWTKNGLSDASTDELQIRRWWKARPLANIGLPIREGYVAVDVDGEHGYAGLKERGWSLGTTSVQSSGRGAHYFYRTRDRIAPRSKLIDDSVKGAHDGVDLRGPGSYVIAAPSLHPSGRVYTWSVPLTQVEVAPAWLEEVGKQSGGTQVGERSPVDFEAVLRGLPEGQRKWEIYRAACKLRAADVPEDLAVMLAEQAAANCTPPLEPKEAERKVREAYKKYPPNAVPGDMPAGVTLLGHDSVMVEFETARFVFSEMEKNGRELRAEMEVTSLLPGTPKEPYTQALNLLSVTSRDQCRREIEHVLGKGPDHQWTTLISRAVTKAKDALLSVDRSVSTADLVAPDALEFLIPDLCVADGINILFGTGSGGKTWLLMKAALAVARGGLFLGRQCKQANVLYVDCETGASTYAYRMRRLCAGEGVTLEDARNIRFWNGKGVPFSDQVPAIRKVCEENEIGLICLDHIAAACGGDANEQSVATQLANGVGKIGLPVLALAHITGADMRNPEAVDKPFGSIFWHNNARRTTFVLRQQEAESSVAELGLYPKKVNDGRWPAPYSARIVFDDPAGPVVVEAADLRSNTVLTAAGGVQHLIWNALTAPMTVKQIAEATNRTERYIKGILTAHPRMFTEVSGNASGGRNREKMWARVELRATYVEPNDDEYVDEELPW
jgi:hypothetical protein